ncbi:MAG: DUF2207 domain-containing protein [Fibromonadaceae bacterium]|jgi:hypothetical protein|nr:DUF2207 domain-containing protein [Fibromonadaceae bacterium]
MEKQTMTLLENEVKLDLFTESVLLTNYRITQEDGNSHKISIFLEKISSIERQHKSKLIFLFLGIFFVIIGLFLSIGAIFVPEIYIELQLFGITMPLFLGIILIIVFFLTRRGMIIVSPDGGKKLNIKLNRKIPNERIEEFITKIQSAKLKRAMS